jgi:hypothetical protein
MQINDKTHSIHNPYFNFQGKSNESNYDMIR